MVPLVDGGLKDFHFLLCDQGTVQPSDQLFCFAGKHGATDDFNVSFVVARITPAY